MCVTLRNMMTKHPLRTYRESVKMTRNQLAEKLGVSPALVSLIEIGRRRVTPENARDWEKIIPVTKEALCPAVFKPSDSLKAA